MLFISEVHMHISAIFAKLIVLRTVRNYFPLRFDVLTILKNASNRSHTS